MALTSPPRVLHLATHGFYLPGDAPEPMLLSGVALAGANRALAKNEDDGILFALEAQGLNLDGSELVVLSACDTASGTLDYAEGVYGLVRALRTAGARNVLVTLWPVKMVWGMAEMDMSECSMSPTGLNYLAWLTVMWAVMMTAMMLPSATPMTWAFVRFARTNGRNAGPGLPTAAFVGGYLLAWMALSLAAALVQWVLGRAGFMSPMTMALPSETVAGGILLVAGLYQWMPLKHACLRRCRTPIGFLMT